MGTNDGEQREEVGGRGVEPAVGSAEGVFETDEAAGDEGAVFVVRVVVGMITVRSRGGAI